MKKKLKFVIVSIFLLCHSINCFSAENGVLLSLKPVFYWNNSTSNSFDAKSNTLKISGQYNACVCEVNIKNASDNNFLEIKYADQNHQFNVMISYSNGKEETTVTCVNKKNVAYIPLDAKLKNSVKYVSFINNEPKDLTVTITSIKFVKEKELPPPEIDNGKAVAFNTSISAIELVKQMKAGWNLGNTLDANGDWLPKASLDSETCWGEEYTTEDIIQIGLKNGLKTIRIPVTWYNHIIDDKYTIDSEWMRRVKTIVNWAIEDGYFVILNEHHSVRDNMNNPLKYSDGYIIRNSKTDIAESKAFLKAIWTQIAAAFNNSYDEHLIFETMNEPRNTGHEHTWQPGLKMDWCDNRNCEECIEDYKLLNEYNQICLDAIRASGGNNSKRFVMIPALCTDSKTALNDLFKMPEDSAKDKLILTVHDYSLGTQKEYAIKTFNNTLKTKIDEDYKALNDKYISKGIPIVIGEFGAITYVPLKERVKWVKYLGSLSQKYGMSLIYFESGGLGENEGSIFDRKNLSVRPEQKALVDAFVGNFK